MTQLHLGLNLSTKRTRKPEFLDEMRRVVPWSRLIALIEPHYPKAKTGRPPFPVATMLQIHFLQQWFGLSDPAMEEALYDVPLYREFAGLDGGMTRLPDETTILRFRHLLEAHGIAAQILAVVNGLLKEKGLMLNRLLKYILRKQRPFLHAATVAIFLHCEIATRIRCPF
jgi:IS5 family transposase